MEPRHMKTPKLLRMSLSVTVILINLSNGLSLTTLMLPSMTRRIIQHQSNRPFHHSWTPRCRRIPNQYNADIASSSVHTGTALLTTPIFHIGHSHAHHHHHDHNDNNDTKNQLTPTQRAQKRMRRIALWVFCALAILGPKCMATPRVPIQRADWMTVAISIVALSSTDTLRRNLVLYWHKLQGFGSAIAKHSSSPSSLPSRGTNKLLSKTTTTTTSKSNVLYALKNLNNKDGNVRDTLDADRVTWVGVVINIVLSVGKFVVGVQQNSSVLIADAGHSFSDLISDFITLWSVRIARLPPDDDHPYGHYKFEALGSLFLSLTLIGTGLSVGAMSHKQLLPFLVPGGMAAAKAAAETIPVPGAIALVMAGISIASKEWLYRITKEVGEKLNSPVVVANAFHHRSDAISSVLALLSIAWAMAGFAAADAAAGLLVAGMIAMTGCDILAESIQQLSDSANLDLQDELREVVEEWVDTDPDVLQITTLRARQVGSASFCDVTVETWPDLTTTATRAVEERLKRYLVPKLQERTGQWITATVNAKAPLEVKDMMLQEEGDDDVDGSRINNAASDTSGSGRTTPGSQDSFKVMDAVTEDLTASQVEMRVRQCALQLDSTAYRLQSVQVHYLSPESVSVDITLDQSKMGLDDLKESARSLQSALENDLEEIQSARIYLDLIGRGREHGVSEEVSAVSPPPSIRPPSVVPTKRQLPDTENTDIHGQGDLSLLEVDPEWLSSFAYDMQQIWNESKTQSTNSTFNRQ